MCSPAKESDPSCSSLKLARGVTEEALLRLQAEARAQIDPEDSSIGQAIMRADKVVVLVQQILTHEECI